MQTLRLESRWEILYFSRAQQEAGDVRGREANVLLCMLAEAEHGFGESSDADRGAGCHAACPLAAPPPLLRLHIQAVAAQVLLGRQASSLGARLPTLLCYNPARS